MPGEYDVIVVGGGPGGSACANILASQKIKTLLLDKASFPRDKTCGDEIGEKCIGILRELGAEDEIKKAQHTRVYGLITSSPSGIQIESTENAGFQQYVCKREIFDNILFQLAKKKADTLENFTVTDLLMDGNKVAGVIGTGKDGRELEFRAKIVVGADGANSIVARRLGLNEFDTERSHVAIRAYYENVDVNPERMEVHFLEGCMPGYFWIFPVGDNVSNVGLGMLASEIQKRRLNLKLILEQAVKNSRISGKFKNAKQISEIRGWNLPTGAQKRKRAGDGFLLVGDAASLIDPLTGGGVGNAIISAKLATETIKKALDSGDFSHRTLSEYEVKIDDRLEEDFRMRYRIVKRATNRAVVDAVFEVLAGDSGLAEQLFREFMRADSRTKPKIPIRFYLAVLRRLLPRYLLNRKPK